jgi:hypothetical protein
MPWIEDFLRSLINPDDIVVEPLQQPIDPTMSDWELTAQRRKRDEINRRRKLGLGEEKDHWITRAGEGDPVEKYMRDLSTGKESAPQDMEGDFWDRSGLSPDEVMVLGPQKVAERQALESGSNERDLREDARKKLLEAAGIKNQQQEFMQGTVPLIEDYDKRIAIGGQPGRGSAEDIMFRIRAEARAKGRGGDLRGNRPTEEDYRASVTPTGGSFITADMTPELQQRLDERDAWTAEQPMRDAAFALSPQQLRRSPEGGAGAEYLRRIGQDQMETVRRERASQMLQKFVGPSGKIPADAARKLAMMDPIFAQIIPPDAIGMSREQASQMIDAELMSAQQIVMSSAGDINDMAKPIKVELVNRVYPLAEAAKKRIAMGEDPELVMQDYRSKVAAINYELMQSPIFQQMIGPVQPVAGE